MGLKKYKACTFCFLVSSLQQFAIRQNFKNYLVKIQLAEYSLFSWYPDFLGCNKVLS